MRGYAMTEAGMHNEDGAVSPWCQIGTGWGAGTLGANCLVWKMILLFRNK